MTSSIVTCATLQPVNKIAPTGGVIHPIHRLKVIITPKCTGFIPKLSAIGRNIGVKIKMAGVGSINVPKISKMIFIRNKIIIGLSEKPRIESAIRLGILVNAKIHDMIEERPIKKTMIQVNLEDSNKILGKSDIFIVLYKKESIKA